MNGYVLIFLEVLAFFYDKIVMYIYKLYHIYWVLQHTWYILGTTYACIISFNILENIPIFIQENYDKNRISIVGFESRIWNKGSLTL